MTKKICVSDIILCCILFFLPFIHVSIGLSVADQGYNLANFEAFPDMNRTWMVATLVANIVGKIFTFLPFGHSMLGMNGSAEVSKCLQSKMENLWKNYFTEAVIMVLMMKDLHLPTLK